MYEVSRVERSQGQEIIDWIQDSIKQFHFPKQVLNWRASKFLEQDFFMRIAGHALENMPGVKDTPEKFYKKINLMNQWEFPSFFMVHKVADFLKQRPQKQKPSDYFDIPYLALLPYVSMFLCDREVYSAITQVSKSYKMKIHLNHCIMPQFLELFTKK